MDIEQSNSSENRKALLPPELPGMSDIAVTLEHNRLLGIVRAIIG